MKYICMNPFCDYCIDQIEFTSSDKTVRCPKCKMTKVGPAELKKYQSPELLEKLRDMRRNNKILQANIIDIDNIPRGE